MVDHDPGFKLGDFVRVTGQLKVDFYLNKEDPPKPSGNLLIIAFEAKIYEKPSDMIAASVAKEKAREARPDSAATERTGQTPLPAKTDVARQQQTPSATRIVTAQIEEPDWTSFYA